MIFIFIQPHFTFNGIYSKNMNVCIATIDNGDFFNTIGVEYSTNAEIENDSIGYSPYFTESSSDTSEIELDLLLYNSFTMEALSINQYNLRELYDWLITDEFVPFISDDDRDIIYYFKVINLSKILTFDGRGYLRVTFKPYTKYCYKRKVYEINVNNTANLEIYNYSKLIYKPIIEVTNLGNETTINKINDMEIVGLKSNEKIKIDNLTKLILDENDRNKFNCCNARWVKLNPRTNNIINISGNCSVKIICEFPIFY